MKIKHISEAVSLSSQVKKKRGWHQPHWAYQTDFVEHKITNTSFCHLPECVSNIYNQISYKEDLHVNHISVSYTI